jgi:hypothetical protein
MDAPHNRPGFDRRPLLLLAAGIAGLIALAPGLSDARSAVQPGRASWLAGDHHVHSEYSVGWNNLTLPPTPVPGGDGRYAIATNAQKGFAHGLSWMVSTDHGGPNHSKLNRDVAYPAVVRSRAEVPGLILFYGMELDTPGADHSSLIIPHSPQEREALFDIESRFAKYDTFPRQSTWDSEPRMLEALAFMKAQPRPPVLIANHPARSATALGAYGLDTPGELRDWNDAAPTVAIGMEGAPGHQATAINRDSTIDTSGARGGYSRHATMGGFDQLTARVGGFWDSMLGEGRRWWITSTSDSHVNWRDGGSDFWPGEYSKTYVHATRTHDDVLNGLRTGRIFVTTGDLVTSVDVTAQVTGSASATIGGTLRASRERDVRVTIRVRDPRGRNFHGDTPEVARVDLIAGDITGPAPDRARDHNPTARVVARFSSSAWTRQGDVLTMTHTFRRVAQSFYVRVRGTNTGQLEPEPDPRGEDPWSDLWFYANPIFIEVP